MILVQRTLLCAVAALLALALAACISDEPRSDQTDDLGSSLSKGPTTIRSITAPSPSAHSPISHYLRAWTDLDDLPALSDRGRLGAMSESLQGDAWLEVALVQQVLNTLGLGPVAIDGYYGPQTAGAVRRFQSSHQIQVDGVVGIRTLESMVEAMSTAGGAVPSTPTFAWLPSVIGRSPSATCADGTASYSTSRSGTCSWHGGASTWLQ